MNSTNTVALTIWVTELNSSLQHGKQLGAEIFALAGNPGGVWLQGWGEFISRPSRDSFEAR